METLADDDEERYKSQFQQYLDDGVEGIYSLSYCSPQDRCANNSIADGLEDLYAEAHAKIRENPNLEDPEKDTRGKDHWKAESEKYRLKKISREEKKANVQKRIAELRK